MLECQGLRVKKTFYLQFLSFQHGLNTKSGHLPPAARTAIKFLKKALNPPTRKSQGFKWVRKEKFHLVVFLGV